MAINYIKLTAPTWTGIASHVITRRRMMIINKAIIASQMDYWDWMDGKPIGTSGDQLFKPKDQWEKILWNDVRNNSKNDMEYMIRQRNNGSMGGRPKKEPTVSKIEKVEMSAPEQPKWPDNADRKTATEMLMKKMATAFKAPPMFGTTIGKTPIPPIMKQFMETEFTPAEIAKLNRWLTENKSGETMQNESILKAACTIAKKNYTDVSARFLRFQLK